MDFLISAASDNASIISYTDQRSNVNQWFRTAASEAYRKYIDSTVCTGNQTSIAYEFCLHDTVLTQSALLGKLTETSVVNYEATTRTLGKKIVK